MAEVKLQALARRLRDARPKNPEGPEDVSTALALNTWHSCVSAVVDAIEETDADFGRLWFLKACGALD